MRFVRGEQIENEVRVALDPRFVPLPRRPIANVGEGLNLEIILDVERHRVDAFEWAGWRFGYRGQGHCNRVIPKAQAAFKRSQKACETEKRKTFS